MEFNAERIELDLSLLEANTGQLEGVSANPRKQSKEEYERLKKSLEEDPEFMEYRELLVVPHRDKYVVVCGNMRIKALAAMGIKKAWCKVLPTDPEKIRRYIIKDDVSYGEWDADMLTEQWGDLPLTEWGLELQDADMSIATDRDEAVTDSSVSEAKVKFGHYNVPLSQEQANRMAEKMDKYLRENSVLIGFFNEFLEND